MFGVRLTRDYGESVPDAWRSAITNCSEFEIARGLRRIGLSGSGSPPTLPQFLKACKQVGDDHGEGRPRPTAQIEELDSRDKWARFADHIFLNYLMRKAGCGMAAVPVLLDIKRKVTSDFRLIGSEENVTAEEMRDELHKQWNKAYVEPTDEECKPKRRIHER